MTYGMWFFQILLALVFLGAGCAKMVLPIEALGMSFPLPPVFVRFIGACEVLGALGLILPGALRIRTDSHTSGRTWALRHYARRDDVHSA